MYHCDRAIENPCFCLKQVYVPVEGEMETGGTGSLIASMTNGSLWWSPYSCPCHPASATTMARAWSALRPSSSSTSMDERCRSMGIFRRGAFAAVPVSRPATVTTLRPRLGLLVPVGGDLFFLLSLHAWCTKSFLCLVQPREYLCLPVCVCKGALNMTAHGVRGVKERLFRSWARTSSSCPPSESLEMPANRRKGPADRFPLVRQSATDPGSIRSGWEALVRARTVPTSPTWPSR